MEIIRGRGSDGPSGRTFFQIQAVPERNAKIFEMFIGQVWKNGHPRASSTAQAPVLFQLLDGRRCAAGRFAAWGDLRSVLPLVSAAVVSSP
jgi:hypothetical protein